MGMRDGYARKRWVIMRLRKSSVLYQLFVRVANLGVRTARLLPDLKDGVSATKSSDESGIYEQGKKGEGIHHDFQSEWW